MLPYASDFLTDLARQAIDGSCFASNVTDQFLTMLAMDNMADYDGDGDFGSLTRLDIEDGDGEFIVVLTLVDLIAYQNAREIEAVDETHVSNTLSHYRPGTVLLGWGGDQKWWADWYTYKADEADKAQAEFAQAYGEFLGEEE